MIFTKKQHIYQDRLIKTIILCTEVEIIHCPQSKQYLLKKSTKQDKIEK